MVYSSYIIKKLFENIQDGDFGAIIKKGCFYD
jgi:hypothetical protein